MQVYFSPISAGVSYIKSGKLRPLGVTTATRSDALPDVPPFGRIRARLRCERLVRHRRAQKIRRPTIVNKLNNEINAGLADPKMKAKFAALGSQPYIATPAEFGKFTLAEAEKWAKVVKFAGIKAD